MTYTIILATGVFIGITVAAFLRRKNKKCLDVEKKSLRKDQVEKLERKEKILDFLDGNEMITNNDVEALLKVSDTTATQYLDELEEEGKVEQKGNTGRSVYYILK